jgi:long-chain fatty acid transport protein
MSRSAKTRCLLVGGAAAASVLTLADAHAGAFALREQSTIGQGMSFAGAGTPGMGLSAMFWNPAAITGTRGFWVETHGAGVIPDSRLSALSGTNPLLLNFGPTSDQIGHFALVPASYIGGQVAPDWYLGLALNSSFGLSTGSTGSSQFLSIGARAFTLDINPVAGWRVNDWLSVGAGPRFLYFKGEFSRNVTPVPTGQIAMLDLRDFGYGFSAGVTLTPWKGTEVALGYRSQVRLNLDGNITLPAVAAPLDGTRPIVANATLPDMATLGIRHRITDTFTLLGTAEWTNWSVVQTIPVRFATGPAAGLVPTTLTFDYRDGWFFSLGAEYDYSQRIKLRAGIGYEISPVRDEVRDTSLPDNNRWWFSAGISHQLLPFLGLDYGYTFIHVNRAPITVDAGHPDIGSLPPFARPYLGVADTDIHIISLSARVRFFSGEAPPAPIITKG